MRKYMSALLLTLALLLSGCARDGEEQAGYRLYFIPDRAAQYGSAIESECWQGEGEPTAWQLMQALLAGPGEEGLTTPFPKGLELKELERDDGAGLVRLTLSEHYSGLNDMSQTLADACIVMTLCQLPGIEAVEISTDGFWASRPASRTLTPQQLETGSLLP